MPRLKALIFQIAYSWAFLFQAGGQKNIREPEAVSPWWRAPSRDFLAMSGEVFSTAISVVKGRDAAKHLKNSQAGPTQQRIMWHYMSTVLSSKLHQDGFQVWSPDQQHLHQLGT